MSKAISTRNLTRRFGRREAVQQLSLDVPEGSICGLLGPNGAGKTTTIHMLLNLLKPSSGYAEVLGVDCRRIGPRQFERIGFLSEEQQLPKWMTVQQLIDYWRPFYPTWDEDFCRSLQRRFDLPLKQRIRTLSRGMRVKAALLTTLAPRPRLLLLDEPFGGLDPLIRSEICSSILELAEAGEWTVFLSSHDLSEIENLLDRVALLNQGRLVLYEESERLRERFREVIVPLAAEGAQDLPSHYPEEWIGLKKDAQSLRFVHCNYHPTELRRQLNQFLPDSGKAKVEPMSLPEVFIAIVAGGAAFHSRGKVA